jgi:hypothetical protein
VADSCFGAPSVMDGTCSLNCAHVLKEVDRLHPYDQNSVLNGSCDLPIYVIYFYVGFCLSRILIR